LRPGLQEILNRQTVRPRATGATAKRQVSKSFLRQLLRPDQRKTTG